MIRSGRGDHVVQLTVERHLPAGAAVPEPEIPQFELKVRDAYCGRTLNFYLLHFFQLSMCRIKMQPTDVSKLCSHLFIYRSWRLKQARGIYGDITNNMLHLES